MISKKALIEFFKISPIPTLVLRPDAPKFTIIEVNDIYLEATCSERSDLVGKGIFEAFPDNESDPEVDGVMKLSTSLNKIIVSKKKHKMATQKYDIPIRGTSEFETKYWNPENIPLLDDKGNLEMILHTVIDVTEIVLAKKDIEESKIIIEKSTEILKQTENISKIGRWEQELSTGKIYWHDTVYQMLGYQPQEFEMTAANLVKILHPDDLERRNAAFKEALEEQKDYKIELRFIAKDKSIINIIVRGVFIYDKRGKPKKMVGTLQDITDIKTAQALAKKAIEDSNERFEYVNKATFDAIWDWDVTNDTIFWGEGFESIFNHKISDLETSSNSWRENIHPDDLQRVTDSFYTIIKSNESNWIEEYLFKKGNGDYAYVINKGIIIRDENNRATRIIGAMHDITKNKKEEQRLKLLETVITNTNDAIVIKEANPSSKLGRKIIYVNDAFTRMTGYSQSEIEGKTHKVLQGPNSNKKELEKFYKALDEQKGTEITIKNYKKNGEEYWVNLIANPVFNDKGEHTHWVSIERDVTERKKQEHELAEINQKLQNTLESIQDGFYTLDNDWKVTYWNHEAELISGRSQEEMLGKNFWKIYEGQISNTIYKKYNKAKKQNKSVHFEVYSKIRKKWYELNAFPSNIGLTVYFKDIDDRKQNEAKLKKINKSLETHVKKLAISNQELEQFAYVASHDLQEPLRMVTGFLTQIEKKYDAILDEKGKKYIFFAVDGAKRMRQIILDLLDFSRIGKTENILEEINVTDIIDEIALLYRKQIEEKKATINYINLPKIINYATPLKQIFQNLISNSLKYSKASLNPIITISSEETPHDWKFTIEDNGIGIHSEYFNRIFIIFQRLHNKDEYSGTGMGLAITKKILENLGGQIWLESEEGVGTTFYFTIPKKQIKKL